MKTTSKHKNITVELSILVNQNGLSFCTLDQRSNSIDLLEHREFESTKNPVELLNEVNVFLDAHPLGSYTINKVKVVYANDLYAIVPNEVFDENHLADYLKYSIKILKTDFIAHDQLDKLKAQVVFIPLANINNYIFERFGSFEYTHSCSILIETLVSLSRKPEQAYLYLHVTASSVDVLFFKDNGLLLCNTFTYYTPEDFIYYILFCFEQLKLDPNQVETSLMGAITNKSDTYALLYSYVRHVSFLDLSKLTPHWQTNDNLEHPEATLLLASL